MKPENIMLSKITRGQTSYDSIYIRGTWKVEQRLPGAQGEGEMGSYFFKTITEFLFGMIKVFWEMNNGDDGTTLQMH